MQGHGKNRQKNSTISPDVLKDRFGDHDNLLKVYLDICRCLSGRSIETKWEKYSEDDWKLFERMASRENVETLINSKKSELKELLKHIPINIWLKFTSQRMRAKYTNELRYKELNERVFPAIRPLCDKVVMLKGGALALVLYDDISLRSMCDFDILINDRNTAELIYDALKAFGYKKSYKENSIDKDNFNDKDLSLEITFPFRNVIEFHWSPLDHHLTYGGSLPDWFRSEARPVCDNPYLPDKEMIHILSPTASFVLQVIHCYLSHRVSSMSLNHIYETYYIAEKWHDQIDFDTVLKNFSERGWLPVLKIASDSIMERFGKDIFPADYLDDVGKLPRILASTQYNNKSHAALYLFSMRSLSLRMKVKVFVEGVFPNKAYIRERYSNYTRPVVLLYLKRWLDALSDIIKIIRN